MVNPFFSVCIPVYNGGHKIIDALNSIVVQTFTDFEVIVVDDKSTDGTFERATEFLKTCNFQYSIYQNTTNLGMVNNWNRPLEFARGHYIACLHHDDQYTPTHLEEAYKILIKYDNIGIYAVGNQTRHRPIIGLIEPEDYFRYTYKIEDVSPPSETIFRRACGSKKYCYNADYVYCPEVELYLEIASDSFRAYHNNLQTVIRHCDEYSNTGIYAFTWTLFIDAFKIIEKYKYHKYINQVEYDEAFNYNVKKAWTLYTIGRRHNLGNSIEINKIYISVKELVSRKSKTRLYQLYIHKLFFNLNLVVLNLLVETRLIKLVLVAKRCYVRLYEALS